MQPGLPDVSHVDVDGRPDDHVALARLTGRQGPSWAGWLWWSLRVLVLAGLVLLGLREPLAWWILSLDVAAFVVGHLLRRRTRVTASASLSGRYRVMAEGLQRSSATGSSIVAWRAIDAVTQSGNHVFVRVGTTVWVLPFRCFASEEHRTQFVRAVAAHRSAASMPPPPPVAPPPAG